MITTGPDHYHSAIVGAGPAGTGPLVYGAWSGRLGELLGRGLAVIESGAVLGAGRLTNYAINSNSTGATFLDCLEHGISAAYLPGSTASPLRQQIDGFRDDVLPLSLASSLLKTIGDDLLLATARSETSHAYLNTRADEVRVLGPGKFELSLTSHDAGTTPRRITASRVLLATGGNAQVARTAGAMVAAACARHGVTQLPMMLTSDDLLQEDGRRGVEAWLENFEHPQVLVIGGGHSAFSSAWLLLERMRGDFDLRDGAVVLLHRSPVKVFYETVTEAQADGFDAYSEQDIGTKGQVFPIGGLRGDAKALYCRIAGVGNAPRESRVRLAPLPASQSAFDALDVDWENIALVVFATGYIQPEVAIRNARGNPIALHGQFTERYVDQQCRVLDVFGSPIPGLFATGFTSGFSPVEMLGGEASYAGKENSVWLCQHMLGESLFNALMQA